MLTCYVRNAGFGEKELHIGVPWVVGGFCLMLFQPLYVRAFAAGFIVIVISLTLAYSSQSIMFARVTGERHVCMHACVWRESRAIVGQCLT